MTNPTRARRWPWLLLACFAAVLALGLAFTQQSSCPDPGECTTTVIGGSFGILVIVALVVTAAWALNRAITPRR